MADLDIDGVSAAAGEVFAAVWEHDDTSQMYFVTCSQLSSTGKYIKRIVHKNTPCFFLNESGFDQRHARQQDTV